MIPDPGSPKVKIQADPEHRFRSSEGSKDDVMITRREILNRFTEQGTEYRNI